MLHDHRSHAISTCTTAHDNRPEAASLANEFKARPIKMATSAGRTYLLWRRMPARRSHANTPATPRKTKSIRHPGELCSSDEGPSRATMTVSKTRAAVVSNAPNALAQSARRMPPGIECSLDEAHLSAGGNDSSPGDTERAPSSPIEVSRASAV